MKILYYGNIIYTLDEFKSNVLNEDYIDGIVLNTVMTKDQKMVIISFDNIENTVLGIENYTYEESKEGNLLLLSDVLEALKNINKRILINAVITPPLLNFKDLDTYTTNLTTIINRYSSINISVFSVNYAVINALKPKLLNNKIGVLLNAENANYIDVDFYIFPPILLNTFILNQQYNRNKEIMIFLQNFNDLNQMNNFFTNSENTSRISRQLMNDISVLTTYPRITYNTTRNL